MGFIFINNDKNQRIFCSESSESLQHFIDMKMDVETTAGVIAVRRKLRVYTDKKR